MFPDVEKLHGDRDGKLDALARPSGTRSSTTGYVPRIVRQSAELLAPHVGHYVFVSTISVYSDEKTLGQDETARSPDDACRRRRQRGGAQVLQPAQGRVRGRGDRRSTARGRRSSARATSSGRATRTTGFTHWAARCARGGDVLAPGDGNDPVQYIDVRDLGAFIVELVERDAGGAFNATGPAQKLTMKPFLDACQQAAGAASKLVWVSEAFLRAHGINPDDDAREDLPLWVPNSALGQVAIARALAHGLTPRPVVATARDTLAWWNAQPAARRDKPMRAGLTDERERAILADLRPSK